MSRFPARCMNRERFLREIAPYEADSRPGGPSRESDNSLSRSFVSRSREAPVQAPHAARFPHGMRENPALNIPNASYVAFTRMRARRRRPGRLICRVFPLQNLCFSRAIVRVCLSRIYATAACRSRCFFVSLQDIRRIARVTVVVLGTSENTNPLGCLYNNQISTPLVRDLFSCLGMCSQGRK